MGINCPPALVHFKVPAEVHTVRRILSTTVFYTRTLVANPPSGTGLRHSPLLLKLRKHRAGMKLS